MNTPLLSLVALATVTAALYAHFRLARFTRGAANVAIAHAILAIVGLALGITGAVIYRTDPILAFFAFVIGFGVVHVPAAFILFFKQQRHASKS